MTPGSIAEGSPSQGINIARESNAIHDPFNAFPTAQSKSPHSDLESGQSGSYHYLAASSSLPDESPRSLSRRHASPDGTMKSFKDLRPAEVSALDSALDLGHGLGGTRAPSFDDVSLTLTPGVCLTLFTNSLRR